MTEITQADIEAAIYCDCLTEERRHIVAEHFARHREHAEQATVARIVAWLRDQNQLRIAPMAIANAIEAGEWKR